MNLHRGRPLSMVREMSHPNANHNYRPPEKMDSMSEEEHIEMEPLNPSPDKHPSSASEDHQHESRNSHTATRSQSVCSTEAETNRLSQGIFFMLFSWISPTMDVLNKNSPTKENRDEFENNLAFYIKKCLPKERAKVNHKRWETMADETPAGKLTGFVFWRIFGATLFHFISIIFSFLTLVWALDHLFMYLAEVLSSGNRFQMDKIVEGKDVTTIEAVPSRDMNKVLAAKWLQFFILCEIIRAFSTSITSIILIRSAIRVHQALSSAVYERIFELTEVPEKFLSPLSFELKTISNSIQAVPYVLGYGLTFFLTIGYSFWVLGLSYFITLVLFGVFVFFHTFIQYKNSGLTQKRKDYKDLQITFFDRIFENLRVFKLFSIENVMQKIIIDLKKEELIIVRTVTFLHMMLITLKMFRPLFLTITSVVLVPYAFHQTVSIEHAFKLLIVNYWSVHLPKMFSHEINILTKSMSELKKLEVFFSEKNEFQPNKIEETHDENMSFELSSDKVSQNEDLICIESGKKVCIKSPEDTEWARNFVTFFGQTKTSDNNQIFRRRGRVAFMPESPWILNGTVQENIVFGNLFDQARFDHIRKQCCLDGVKPERMVDNESLSAGEIHRISLARVLYSNADIYILEELFSHLDSDTVQTISDNLSNDEEFQRKTVIFNSKNDQKFALRPSGLPCDYIVFDKDGKIVDEKKGDALEVLSKKPLKLLEHQRIQQATIVKWKALCNPMGRLVLSSNKTLPRSRSSIRFQKIMTKSQERSLKMEEKNMQSMHKSVPADAKLATIGESATQSNLLRSNTSRQVSQEKSSTNSEIIRYEFKQIWYFYIWHALIATMYMMGNFLFQWKMDLWIYYAYFLVIYLLHVSMAHLFAGHSNERLTKFYEIFLKKFFNTSLEFLEGKSHGRIKLMLDNNFSKIEISVLKRINNIFFRAAGAIVAQMIIFGILIWPSGNIFGSIFHPSPFQPKNFLSLTIYLIALLYPFAVTGWIYWQFREFKFCLDCLLIAEQNFGAELDNYFTSTVLGHQIIHIDHYYNWSRQSKNDGSQKEGLWWVEKFYTLSDQYQGSNWILESMTHWWNIRVDLWLIGYVMALWICGVYFLEEFGEASAVLLIIFALIINYFLQFFFTNAFRFYLEMGSFRQISKYRELMKKFREKIIIGNDQSLRKDVMAKHVKDLLRGGSISFNAVFLKYPDSGEDEYALKEINFKISHSEKVLITGKSGSGKTSIIAALFQLFPLKKGSIKINNNVRVTGLDIHAYRSAMSIIPQKPVLFFNTVRENLQTDPNNGERATHDEAKIREALRVVGLKDIELDKTIESDEFFSVKEIQAIYLAKAILDQKPLIAMDEFPSRLKDAEKNTFDIIYEKFPNQTVLYVTHLDNEKDIDFSKSQSQAIRKHFTRKIVIDNAKVISDESKDICCSDLMKSCPF